MLFFSKQFIFLHSHKVGRLDGMLMLIEIPTSLKLQLQNGFTSIVFISMAMPTHWQQSVWMICESSILIPMYSALTVSYTHLTLPTILLVQISVVAVSLKKKKQHQSQQSQAPRHRTRQDIQVA
eukprot:TRINITY_DN46292_c0_g1_i1.p1 TRINITY_DN46292_c0_g1~~TRINITY_DN46292_c0_g1_i1.p1  ORF type:complete len:124 (-),score=10.69 TRINITY_DN46292_c0_g1_i1:24-395(-)